MHRLVNKTVGMGYSVLLALHGWAKYLCRNLAALSLLWNQWKCFFRNWICCWSTSKTFRWQLERLRRKLFFGQPRYRRVRSLDVDFALSDIRKNCTNADNLLLAAKPAIASVVSTLGSNSTTPGGNAIAFLLKSRLAKAPLLALTPTNAWI